MILPSNASGLYFLYLPHSRWDALQLRKVGPRGKQALSTTRLCVAELEGPASAGPSVLGTQ